MGQILLILATTREPIKNNQDPKIPTPPPSARPLTPSPKVKNRNLLGEPHWLLRIFHLFLLLAKFLFLEKNRHIYLFGSSM
jgi:hypothetical protein